MDLVKGRPLLQRLAELPAREIARAAAKAAAKGPITPDAIEPLHGAQ